MITQRVRMAAMFGRIARRYDLVNSVITFGMDAGWRRAAVAAARLPPGGRALDVGTGTGKLARALARSAPGGCVVGVDVSREMLRRARAELAREALAGRVELTLADALALPFPEASFDCATTAFTVRNLADVRLAFAELRRVVKPGGRVVCLELSQPRTPVWGTVFRCYFRRLVPVLGGVVTGDPSAYAYLHESVAAFLRPEALAGAMEQAGLREVRWRRLGLGSVTLHVGVR